MVHVYMQVIDYNSYSHFPSPAGSPRLAHSFVVTS